MEQTRINIESILLGFVVERVASQVNITATIGGLHSFLSVDLMIPMDLAMLRFDSNHNLS
jgi:hypothetical protein